MTITCCFKHGAPWTLDEDGTCSICDRNKLGPSRNEIKLMDRIKDLESQLERALLLGVRVEPEWISVEGVPDNCVIVQRIDNFPVFSIRCEDDSKERELIDLGQYLRRSI